MQANEKLLLESLPTVGLLIEGLATFIELAAVIILLIGAARFAWDFLRSELGGGAEIERGHLMNHGRLVLGRYILVALEVLIVADLILTVLTQTLERLGFLAALVILRAVMSWFLENEIRAIEKHEEKQER